MRKIIIFFIIVFISSTTVLASNNKINVVLDGNEIQFDTEPIMIDGRVMIPIRQVVESLGASITWENDTKTIITILFGSVIVFQIDNPYAFGYYGTIELDVPPQIINGRTLIPIRFLVENSGCNVEWDVVSNTVYIKTPFKNILLEENVENIILGNEVTIPAEYKIIDFAVGDLNNDNLNDLAVVIDKDDLQEMRYICILLQNSNGEYVVKHKNTKLLLKRNVNKDPFDEIKIKDGNLIINESSLGNYWNFKYAFGYVGEEFVLNSSTVVSTIMYEDELEVKAENSRNFSDNYVEYYITKDDDKQLIYNGEGSGKKHLFDNVRKDSDLDNNLIFLPYNYLSDESYEMNITPQEALDKAKEMYYPNAEKCILSWTEETKKNFTNLYGYSPPNYYYTDGDCILRYSSYLKKPYHCVSYGSEEEIGLPLTYFINDNTGGIYDDLYTELGENF